MYTVIQFVYNISYYIYSSFTKIKQNKSFNDLYLGLSSIDIYEINTILHYTESIFMYLYPIQTKTTVQTSLLKLLSLVVYGDTTAENV